MPYRGKPSKGCAECRRKKQKCDQVRPQCTECVKRGVTCPGYRDMMDLMFCDESETTIRRSEKAKTKSRSKSDSPPADFHQVVTVVPKSATSKSASLKYAARKLFFPQRPDYADYFAVPRFASDVVDPFRACVAPALKPNAQKVIRYFSSNFEGACLPVRADGSPGVYLEYIMQHELLFYTYMSGLSARYALLQADPKEASDSNVTSAYYRQETLRLLNKKLSSTKNPIDDASVSAVLTLARQAIADGNVKVSRIHMEGLYRMVSLVGGLQGVSANLRETLWWHDFCYSAAFNVALEWEYPNQTTPDSSTLPIMCFLQPDSPLFALATGFLMLSQISKIFDNFRPLVVELRLLAIIENLGHSGPYRVTMHQRCSLQEAQLEELQTKSTKIASLQDAALFEAVRLAFSIFSRVDLRREPLVPEPVLRQLQVAIMVARSTGVVSGLEKLYLWFFFLGAKNNLDTEMGGWFLDRFEETMEELGMTDVLLLQCCLNSFMWVFWKNAPELEELFARIQSKKLNATATEAERKQSLEVEKESLSSYTADTTPTSSSSISIPLTPSTILPDEREPGDISLYRGELLCPTEMDPSLMLDLETFEAILAEESKLGRAAYDDEDTAKVVLSQEELLLQAPLATEVVPKVEETVSLV